MATPIVYVICDQNCKFEGMTKEQIYTAIMQAVNEGTIGDIDAGFITTIKTINGTPLKFFVGEQAEYDALTDEDKKDLFAIITNDTTKEGLLQALEDLKTAAKTNAENIAKNAEAIQKNAENIEYHSKYSYHTAALANSAERAAGTAMFTLDASILDHNSIYLVELVLTEDYATGASCHLTYCGMFLYNSATSSDADPTWDCGLGQMYIRFTHNETDDTLTATTFWTQDGEGCKYGGFLRLYKVGYY